MHATTMGDPPSDDGDREQAVARALALLDDVSWRPEVAAAATAAAAALHDLAWTLRSPACAEMGDDVRRARARVFAAGTIVAARASEPGGAASRLTFAVQMLGRVAAAEAATLQTAAQRHPDMPPATPLRMRREAQDAELPADDEAAPGIGRAA